MRYGGYTYDDDTGEFRDVPGVRRKSRSVTWSWHLPHLHFPSISFPRIRLPQLTLDWKSWLGSVVSLLVLPVLLLRYVAILLGRLIRFLVLRLVDLVVVLVKPLSYILYPFVKWWQVEHEAIRDGDWLMAVIWLLPLLFLVGLYRAVVPLLFGLTAGAFSSVQVDDSLKTFIAVGAIASCVVLYAKALTMARQGQLVVYQDWGDFAKSAVWVIAIPLGISWIFEDPSDFLFQCAGLALAVIGAVSFWLMVSGAFKCNSGSTCWLSLFARVAVILLFVFALGRLQEKLEQYRRGKLGVMRGVLMPLAVFAGMFNYLVRPMVLTERRRW